jgi:hypothetical protein
MPGLDRDLPGRRLRDDHSRLNQANESGSNKPEGPRPGPSREERPAERPPQ